MALRLDAADAGFAAAFAAVLDAKRETETDVGAVVADILADVRARGDDAVIDYTRRFDRFALSPETMALDAAQIDEAVAACDADALAALRVAVKRIEDFHRRQMPSDDRYRDDVGVELGTRWRPVAAAGLYVPGGTAAYPSSVLMNAVPARVAGVQRLVMAVPAPDGEDRTNIRPRRLTA